MTQADNDTGILWLKLDHESKQLLQRVCPHKYPDIYYDHVTLAFGVTKESVGRLTGSNAKVYAYAYASNAQIEAVRVRTGGLPDTYGAPHITLSAQKDVEPFESVAMLKADHEEHAIDPPIELKGYIEFIPLF